LAEVFHHFAHLLMRAFVSSYSFLGTSPGGLAAQVLTIFTTEVQGGWWRPSAWKANWQGGLRRAVYTLLVVWAVTFSVCTITTIYHDHQNIAGRLRAVVREKDELKNGLELRDKYIQQFMEANARPSAPATQAETPVPTVINAPGGIPIFANKGIVDHPTVNNFAPAIRDLTNAQKQGIAEFLKTIPQSALIGVGSVYGSGDGDSYANQFFPLLAGRHYDNQTSPAIRTGFPVTFTGVFVATATDDDPSVQYRDAFVRELARLGIEAHPANGSKIRPGNLELVIGYRPEEVRRQ